MTVTTQKPHTTLKALSVALIIALIISGFIAIFHTERDALGETAFTIAFILVIGWAVFVGPKGLAGKSNICMHFLLADALSAWHY